MQSKFYACTSLTQLPMFSEASFVYLELFWDGLTRQLQAGWNLLCSLVTWTDWPWIYFPLVPALKFWDYRHAPVCLTPLVQYLGFCLVYILLLLTGLSMSLRLVDDTLSVSCWDGGGEEQNRIRQFWVTSWLLKRCYAKLSREELEQRITLFFFKRAIISHS